MTKSERETLERHFAEMLPKEQQDLQEYIRETFGKKEPGSPAEDTMEDPIARMEQRTWAPPSSALKGALSKASLIRPGTSDKESSGDPS